MSIFEELSVSEDLLCKYLHRPTQKHNRSFNGVILEKLPKSRYVSFVSLQFGVHDVVANLSISKKAAVLMFEKLGMIPGQC